ncbi:MAG: MFS transporter [Methylovirgula sp.]|uniref:MFS transporter n=1 Tax=Methylovirgula sp. TaxID=1978224 RepID=UPI003076075B
MAFHSIKAASDESGQAVAGSWYRSLSAAQRAAFWSSFAGHAADAMDTQMFSFAIPALLSLWSLTKGEAGQIASISLIMSAVGGWGAGVLADRFGRVKILQWTIVLFSLCSVASGLAQNYGQLLTARALLGLGFGGETAISAVLVAEIMPTIARGRMVGLVQGGWAIGWGIAALLSTLCQLYLDPHLAWRVMFLVGAAPAALIFVLRRYVPEPPMFIREEGATRPSALTMALSIFAAGRVWRTILATFMCAGIMGGFFAVMVWLPTYLKLVKNLSVVNTGAYLAFVILGSFSGYVFGSFTTDSLGRKKTLALFSLGALATIYVYTQTNFAHGILIWIGFPLGVFTSGIYASIGSFLAELFPTSIRANAQGFAFNVGRALGSVFPMMIGYASAKMPLGTAICIFATISYVLLFLVLLLLPETKGQQLET